MKFGFGGVQKWHAFRIKIKVFYFVHLHVLDIDASFYISLFSLNSNETLTNDVVSFEQLGPDSSLGIHARRYVF